MLHITVGQMFRRAAEQSPHALCVETADSALTYAQIDERTDRLAGLLLSRGFRKGRRAGVWCKDTPDFLCLYLALEKLGCVPVLLNTALTGSEMAALLRKVDGSFLFYDDGFRGTDFPREVRELGLTDAAYLPELLADLPELSAADRTRLAEACALVTPEDPDVIIFTSGTSGSAKGVLSTHFGRVNVAQAQVDAIAMTAADKCLITIPLYHCFGLTGVALAALCCGASLFFPQERRTHLLLDAVSQHRCTILSAVPTLYSALLARQDLDRFDLSSLRTGYIGGSIYTPDFFHRVEDTLGLRLAPSLGQTEATAGLSFLSPDEPVSLRDRTVGRFHPALEGQIRDIRTGRPLPVGEVGEICIRGFSVMLGYVNDPEQTRQALEPDGWLHTGDLGRLDEHGCIHLSGRLKELIIRGGENISPGEIEAAILTDARIREVKAVAVPDNHYGEEVCACIVPQPGAAPVSADEVRALAAQTLAAYKVPRYVLFYEALPKTGSGKPALAVLKQDAAARLQLPESSHPSIHIRRKDHG